MCMQGKSGHLKTKINKITFSIRRHTSGDRGHVALWVKVKSDHLKITLNSQQGQQGCSRHQEVYRWRQSFHCYVGEGKVWSPEDTGQPGSGQHQKAYRWRPNKVEAGLTLKLWVTQPAGHINRHGMHVRPGHCHKAQQLAVQLKQVGVSVCCCSHTPLVHL